MKDTLTALLTGLSKWPLLLGAVLAFTLAVYEETVTDNTEVLIGIAGMVVGSVLLGTWLALFIIDFERRWRVKHRDDMLPPDDPRHADTPRSSP